MSKIVLRAIAFFVVAANIASGCVASAQVLANDDLAPLEKKIDELDLQGKRSEAIDVARQALAIAEKSHGTESVKSAHELYRLGNLLRRQLLYKAADPLLRHALVIFEKDASGRDDINVAETLTVLGWTTLGKLQLDQAKQFFQRSLELKERLFPLDTLATAYSLDGLASTFEYLSQYKAASGYAERSLRIKRKELTPSDKEVGNSIVLLAAIKHRNGEVAEAAALFEERLKIEQAHRPLDELSVADLLGMLGIVSADKGDYKSGEQRVRESMAILERLNAKDRGTYIADQNLLATVLISTQRFAEAETVASKLLGAYGSSDNVQARDALQAANSLSLVYVHTNRYSNAEDMLKRALEIAESTFGETSVDVAAVLENLAYLYSSVGRSADALQLFSRITRIREALLPANHALIGSSYANRAVALNKLQRYAEAEADTRRAISILSAVYGRGYPMVLSTMNELATALKGQGRYADAVSTIENGIATTKEVEGEASPRIASYFHSLGLVLDSAGRYQDAENAYLQSLALKPRGTLEEAQTRSVLANVYVKMSRPREARKNFKTAMSIFSEAFDKISTDRREYEGGAWLRSTASAYLATLIDGPDFDEAERKSAASESFEVAQWLMRTRASAALMQVGTRYAAGAGDNILANLVRGRQDAIQRWLTLNGQLDRLISQPIGTRDKANANMVQKSLDAVAEELADTNRLITQKFPKYSEFANPRPVSAQETKELLKPEEVLVQFLVLDQRVIVWVLNRDDDVRTYVAPLSANEVARAVFDLRCGLDSEAFLAPSSFCSTAYRGVYSFSDYKAGKPLPFDAARAHQLYIALFGPGAYLLRGKSLITVLSGALTQLPLQVLLESLPEGSPPSGEQFRDVGLLGVDLTNVARQQAADGSAGVIAIARVTPDGAAARAGLKPSDVILSIDSEDLVDVPQAVSVVRGKGPGTNVQIMALRGKQKLKVSVKLGNLRLREWHPLFLDARNRRTAAWLVRSNAITILPSISSMKALRRYTGVSRASDAYVGFGNPLLDGDPDNYPEDADRAAQTRTKQCMKRGTGPLQFLINFVGRSGLALRDGRRTIDLQELRKWAPLPESADEICGVAEDLGVDPSSHVYIGADASEAVVKRLSQDGLLARHKIVHFATHGVVAGELPTNAEPGLILSPPAKATEADDGYLTASEISALHLDADWVILSACNTAAGDAFGAETLSGLSRAFFYAGARSMLVSHWSVASDASVKLITKAVNELAKNAKIGRAEALRRSVLAMIGSRNEFYTQPSIWAPFVLVGEGGSTQ